MTHAEYQERLSGILQDLCNYVYSAGVASKTYGIFVGGEPMAEAEQALTALCRDVCGEAKPEITAHPNTNTSKGAKENMSQEPYCLADCYGQGCAWCMI